MHFIDWKKIAKQTMRTEDISNPPIMKTSLQSPPKQATLHPPSAEEDLQNLSSFSNENSDRNVLVKQSLDDLVQYVTLHVQKPLTMSGIVLPFALTYSLAFYAWLWRNYDDGLLVVGGIIFIHILTTLCCYWSVHVLAFLNCRQVKLPQEAVLAKVVPTANNGASEMVRIHCTRLVNGQRLYYFFFQKIKYVWDEGRQQFGAIEFPINETLAYYAGARGLKTDEEVRQVGQLYGANEMEMVVPEFHELFIERATAPFFVFQIFSVGLWCLDEYWYYSLFTLCMLVVFECTLVQQQLRNMSEIRKMGNKPYTINVFRGNRWQHLKSDQLLPGDLVSITRSQHDQLVPCDLVILRGNCIVDESMLTGQYHSFFSIYFKFIVGYVLF